MEMPPSKRIKLSVEPSVQDGLLRIGDDGNHEYESKDASSFSVKVLKVDFSGDGEAPETEDTAHEADHVLTKICLFITKAI
ncbi:hypothetical protein SARC_00792 [Sphaeroforma arctica JP610]|uniref:Uncharacterized protein n=1 Tax=Sphaeroforma arctica JP610 TaxID=667725 RepID=A0A0L0GDT3_9EUKA|nr:hypothetical protein SARC_00792 [Sphaeroforma arctica JP610]KNC87046.1 hypothetical protein SARC_00792 [Sphaeroforma arctica JP610]|eukprot:XP_014160948.1 hypothetical protein SARC_00792 [Sphaeroforma arctica JP610]